MGLVNSLDADSPMFVEATSQLMKPAQALEIMYHSFTINDNDEDSVTQNAAPYLAALVTRVSLNVAEQPFP